LCFLEIQVTNCLLGVGKSSLVQRFVMDQFNPNQDPTIGAAFMARNYIYNNTNLKFQVHSFKLDLGHRRTRKVSLTSRALLQGFYFLSKMRKRESSFMISLIQRVLMPWKLGWLNFFSSEKKISVKNFLFFTLFFNFLFF
jgi:hypothetical protein